jgi:hypothetical protein
VPTAVVVVRREGMAEVEDGDVEVRNLEEVSCGFFLFGWVGVDGRSGGGPVGWGFGSSFYLRFLSLSLSLFLKVYMCVYVERWEGVFSSRELFCRMPLVCQLGWEGLVGRAVRSVTMRLQVHPGQDRTGHAGKKWSSAYCPICISSHHIPNLPFGYSEALSHNSLTNSWPPLPS